MRDVKGIVERPAWFILTSDTLHARRMQALARSRERRSREGRAVQNRSGPLHGSPRYHRNEHERMSPKHEPAERVSNTQQLSRPEHLQLLVNLLLFFDYEPDNPQAHRIRELFGKPEFQEYDEAFLRQLVYSLCDSGLLYKPPHLKTRASVYMTTKMGQLVRDKYLQELKR